MLVQNHFSSNMSGPPPPPKKKNHQPSGTIVGAGHNVARSRMNNNQAEDAELTRSQLEEIERALQIERQSKVKESSPKPSEQFDRQPKLGRFKDLPSSSIGKGVEISGEFEFDGLLQIDGKFCGKLLSVGDLIIGSGGCFMGNITTIKRMVVDGGSVHGNISVEELLLMGNTVIKGNITCKLLEVIGSDVTIFGRANVHPLAPELVDENDNIISSIPPKPKKAAKPFAAPIVMPPVVLPASKVADDSPVVSPAKKDLSDLTPEELSVQQAREKHLETKNRRAQQALQAESPQQQQPVGVETPAVSPVKPTAAAAGSPVKQETPASVQASPVKSSADKGEQPSLLTVDWGQELSTNEHRSPRVVPSTSSTSNAGAAAPPVEVPAAVVEEQAALTAEMPISLLSSSPNKNSSAVPADAISEPAAGAIASSEESPEAAVEKPLEVVNLEETAAAAAPVPADAVMEDPVPWGNEPGPGATASAASEEEETTSAPTEEQPATAAE